MPSIWHLLVFVLAKLFLKAELENCVMFYFLLTLELQKVGLCWSAPPWLTVRSNFYEFLSLSKIEVSVLTKINLCPRRPKWAQENQCKTGCDRGDACFFASQPHTEETTCYCFLSYETTNNEYTICNVFCFLGSGCGSKKFCWQRFRWRLPWRQAPVELLYFYNLAMIIN